MVLDWIMIWLFAHVCLISLLLLLLYPCATYNFGTRLTDRLQGCKLQSLETLQAVIQVHEMYLVAIV